MFGASPHDSDDSANTDQADDVDRSAADLVGVGADPEQQRRQRQRVDVDHPLQAGERRVQVGGHVGQRDVHDRDVDQEHEGAERHRDQCKPFPHAERVCDRASGRVQRFGAYATIYSNDAPHQRLKPSHWTGSIGSCCTHCSSTAASRSGCSPRCWAPRSRPSRVATGACARRASCACWCVARRPAGSTGSCGCRSCRAAPNKLAQALARRSDVSWVSIFSGGSEVTCVCRPRTVGQRDELLLDRLPETELVTSLISHATLNQFAGGRVEREWQGFDDPLTAEQYAAIDAGRQLPTVRPAPTCSRRRPQDATLLAELGRDGRASYAALAAATGSTAARVAPARLRAGRQRRRLSRRRPGDRGARVPT